jgi:serine/threonine protein kinase/tetratricopeptide (TPR) repeat protein
MEQGKTILHYEILEKVGEGGMGVVYKAKDTKLDRIVALKFLPPHLTKSKKDRKRFIREAKSSAALNHPNICTIHAVEEHEGKDFISMEYIDGQTLGEKLESGDITFSSALEYALQIAEALGKAHDKGIIHRDIKPGNIMINAENQIKVMDFGLAKMADSTPITKTGATVGTMAYMAPEQIEGKQIDHRADLFSFGVVLYEMLAGERPFQGQYDAALSYAIVNEEPISIQNYLPKAPQKLNDFFDRILAKDPDKRIESAAAARNLLEDIKESSGSNLQRTQETVAATPSTNQETDSGSTTISITLPTFVIGNTSIGRTGLFAGTLAVLALILLAGWWFMDGKPSVVENTPKITERSVAVLPFSALGQEEPGPFTEGIHDDLLTRLSNVADLQVTSRTSVERYQNTTLPLPAIADSLGVRWIVEGRVQEAGGQVQVNAQLIDPETDSNIWADSYQRELTAENLFAIQGEIAGEIATALQAELSEGEQQRIAGAPTQNLEAYRLYVKGRSQLDSRSEDGIRRAVDYFQQALEEDSSYALAWSGLADAQGLSYYASDSLGASVPPQETAARRALELEPNLAEAHASMGQFYLNKMKAPPALRHLHRAMELKPSYAQAYHWMGLLELYIGRPEEALKHLRHAVDLNPQHWAATGVLAWAYLSNGQPEEALAPVQRFRRLNQRSSATIVTQIIVLHHLQRFEEARKIGKRQLSSTDGSEQTGIRFALALAEVAGGDTTRAYDLLEHYKEEQNFIGRGFLSVALGRTDAAFNEFLSADLEHWSGFWITALRYWYPDLLGPLRTDHRYKKLIEKVNQRWGLKPDGSIPEDIDIQEDL